MKKRIFVIAAGLLLAVAVIAGLWVGRSPHNAIDPETVEAITVSHTETNTIRELSRDEFAAVVEQYNAGDYAGYADGTGGTPQFGMVIRLKNGRKITVNQFAGKQDLEVSADGSSRAFYLNSDQLYALLETLALSPEK